MNRKYGIPNSLINAMLIFGAAAFLPWETASAALSGSDCISLSNTQQPNFTTCQQIGPSIRQCIQNNLVSQAPSSGNTSNDLQAVTTASQNLLQLDFQCQYLIAYGSNPSSSNAGTYSNPGFGASLKSMLGLQPQNPSSTSKGDSAAANNQATKLNNIQPKPIPSNQNKSQQNENSSINWF